MTSKLLIGPACLLLVACATPQAPMPPATEPLVFATGEGVGPPGLRTRVRLDVPPGIETVSEAARYILEPTGYQVVLHCDGCPAEAPAIGGDPVSPLAYVAPSKMMTAERAVLLILGNDARLVVDHELRSLSFEFMPAGGVRGQRVVRADGFAATALPAPVQARRSRQVSAPPAPSRKPDTVSVVAAAPATPDQQAISAASEALQGAREGRRGVAGRGASGMPPSAALSPAESQSRKRGLR